MNAPDDRFQADPPPGKPNHGDFDEPIRRTNPPSSPTGDDKTMAVFAHVGGLLTWLLAPIIVWSMKKDKSPWAEDHAREALNFQLALTIYYLVGCIVFPLIMVFEIIVVVQACMAANRGELYRYPLNIRFIK